jgi:sugar phosphate isomerase/epimerase
MDRRQFLERSALALATCAAPALAAEEAAAVPRPRAVFTKTLEKLSADELGAKVAALGVKGIEAPIRAGGHIEPKEAAERLPAFAEGLKKHGVAIDILTSDIGQADKASETLLRAAAALGIKRYRLVHYRYDLKKPVAPQLADVKAKLKDLAAMNRELGVQGQYQNHRGNNYVGGPIWDMVSALEGVDVADLGLAFDFAHATVEGSNTWELNLRRAAPHIAAVYFKDYRLDGRQWNPCPLGQGIVNPKSGLLVKVLLPAGTPVSLHVEYIGGSGEERVKKTFEAMKADLATLEKWLPG